MDRTQLNQEITDAVLAQDLDRLQKLADKAKDDDPDTARDIHGKLIKLHRDKWAG